jgi:hypothetical protein
MSAVAFLLLATASFVPREHLCLGFVPENDLNIPVTRAQVGGINEQDFNAVLDIVQNYYAPVIASKGGHLRIDRRWTDGTVNASADRQGSDWVLHRYGGLARHQVMTKDGFLLVACHETGHHLGGAPKISSWFFSDWASNEGEADYFATLKCLRHVFTDADNEEFVKNNTIDPVLKAKCENGFSNNPDRNLCMRSGTAGLVGAKLFQALRKEKNPPRFETPDPHKVSQMDDNHPGTQCRLDTYYNGSVCFADRNSELNDADPNPGSCSEFNGNVDGNRPRCWFMP